MHGFDIPQEQIEAGREYQQDRDEVMYRMVTVCAACETAACWQGSFMCDYAEAAGTKELTVEDLHSKPRGENAEYWFKDPATGVIDQQLLARFKRICR